MRPYKKSGLNEANNQRYNDTGEYGEGQDFQSRNRAPFTQDRRIGSASSALQSEISECFEHLHDHLIRLEQLLQAQATTARIADISPGSRNEPDHGGRVHMRGAPIQMRDMTNFMLSREGSHFLNLVRQVIREEVESSLSDQDEGAGQMADRDDTLEDDLDRLRALVRQGQSQAGMRRRA